jgi:citrate lyase subunit beta/citryl-CoA lyase
MRKSLQLQAQLAQEMGASIFDVTLDCEDGAAIGAELEQARSVTALLHEFQSLGPAQGAKVRIGVRLHPVDHPAFAVDVQTIVGSAAGQLAFVMLPKVESRSQVDQAISQIDLQAVDLCLPIHVLIESPAALHQVFSIAAHPRVQSMSFGLMDFVSAHGGAIPASAMALGGPGAALDQFHHPLVLRAKMEIASACHAHGKVPSHCVVTELRDTAAIEAAARQAAQAFGFTRMWSIHPDQIHPILRGFAPTGDEVEQAAAIVLAAAAQDWAPIAVQGQLHDRASYRYFWQVLERAHRTAVVLPLAVRHYFA